MQLWLWLDPSTQKSLPAYPEKGILGNCIAANIKYGRTYLLRLQKSNFSDANFFELTIVIFRGNVSFTVKKAIIKLVVGGMEYSDIQLFVIRVAILSQLSEYCCISVTCRSNCSLFHKKAILKIRIFFFFLPNTLEHLLLNNVDKYFNIYAFTGNKTWQNKRNVTKNFAVRFSLLKCFNSWINPFRTTGLFLYS